MIFDKAGAALNVKYIMIVDEFSENLYIEMEEKLTGITKNGKNLLEISRDFSSAILLYISRLKIFINGYHFSNQFEEINFFKNIKPKFLSKLIYHQNVFKIQSRVPPGTSSDLKHYYLKELKKISSFFNNNTDFLTYYRSGTNSFDEVYFVRKDPESWLLMNFEEYETDLNFTTFYDHRVSKIIAFELLAQFIKSAMDDIEIQADKTNNGILEKTDWKNAGTQKVLCNLSVDQMGIVLRCVDDLRILKARSLNTVFKNIVPYLSTPNQKNISYDSMRSKSYAIEARDKEIVIQTLEQMIKKIREY